MASSQIIIFFKRLTILFFIFSIAVPIYSLYRQPMKETGKNFFKATQRLVASLGDGDKMTAIADKSELRRYCIGLRNYLHYLLYERKILKYTVHADRWMDWAVDRYRYQEQQNAVPLAHVEKLAEFLKARGTPWVVLGLPEKSYIYPEKAEARVIRNSGENARFLKTIRSNPHIDYLDAYDIFRANREKYLLFNGVEHHPNNIGNYLGFVLLTREMNAIFGARAPVYSEADIATTTYKTINSRHSFDEYGEVPNNLLSVLGIRAYGIEYPYGYVNLQNGFLDKVVEIYNFATGEHLMTTGPRQKFDRKLFWDLDVLPLTRCAEAPAPLKVLTFGNSNKAGVAIYFTRYFKLTVSKFYGYQEHEFDFGEEVALYKDFVKEFGPPDVVIGVY